MKKLVKAVNATTNAILALEVVVLIVYSIIWLWTFISPRAHFEDGPIGLFCKIMALATILLTVLLVPPTIKYLLKSRKKHGGDIANQCISLILSHEDEIKKLSAEAAKYKAEAEEYKKELDALKSTPE